jgi:hypothetical protein
MSWRDQAACKGCSPAIFFPEQGNSNREAKAICNSCPVQRDCLEAGMNEDFGVWGGMAQDERRFIAGRKWVAATGILETLNDGAWWYSRDIAEAAGLDRNTCQKALKRLHVQGTLERRDAGVRCFQWRWPAAVERLGETG